MLLLVACRAATLCQISPPPCESSSVLALYVVELTFVRNASLDSLTDLLAVSCIGCVRSFVRVFIVSRLSVAAAVAAVHLGSENL